MPQVLRPIAYHSCCVQDAQLDLSGITDHLHAPPLYERLAFLSKNLTFLVHMSQGNNFYIFNKFELYYNMKSK